MTVFCLGGVPHEAISLFLIVLFLRRHFAGEPPLFDSFFLIKEKWAIIKCNAFQMITRDGFIHVTIRVPGVIEELICRMVEIFSMKKLKLIKHNN